MKFNRTWIYAFIVLAVIFILRLPAFWTPILDVDESQFAGFADWLLAGGKPYISSLDTKPLGIYWFYAAIFGVFGRNNMIIYRMDWSRGSMAPSPRGALSTNLRDSGAGAAVDVSQ
ncbi:MAG: hypothetical protein ABH871_06270 [Pseudomonadota bacterium]